MIKRGSSIDERNYKKVRNCYVFQVGAISKTIEMRGKEIMSSWLQKANQYL